MGIRRFYDSLISTVGFLIQVRRIFLLYQVPGDTKISHNMTLNKNVHCQVSHFEMAKDISYLFFMDQLWGVSCECLTNYVIRRLYYSIICYFSLSSVNVHLRFNIIFCGTVIEQKYFPYFWPITKGNHRSPEISPHKEPIIRTFDVFVVANLNKEWNKQLSCRWFATSICSCSVIVMQIEN